MSAVKNVHLRVCDNNSYELINSDECEEMNFTYSTEPSIEKQALVLEDFQKRQQLMEEQNKRRRDVLTKAIADRYILNIMVDFVVLFAILSTIKD